MEDKYEQYNNTIQYNNNLSNSNTCYRDFFNPSTFQSIYLNPTAPTDIGNIIREIKSKYSYEMDGTPTSVLKNSPDNILTALSHVVNLSLSQGIFFPSFNTAKVIPVFKKSCATDVNNYRLISLFPAMSKILEKLMYKRVMSFLTQQKFFFDGQFGFRKNMVPVLIMLSLGLCKTLWKHLKINN